MVAPETAAPPPDRLVTWTNILSNWPAIFNDLFDRGVDCYSGILDERPWQWFYLLIRDLIDNPNSRLSRAVHTR